MSEENVEIVCRSIQAYNDRDVEGMLEYFAPDAVVDWSNSRGINAHVVQGARRAANHGGGLLWGFRRSLD